MPQTKLRFLVFALAAAPPALAQNCDNLPLVESYGLGSTGSAGVPRVRSAGAPSPESPFGFFLDRLAPGVPGGLFLGFAPADFALPSFGASGYLAQGALLATFVADDQGIADGLAGTASVPLAFCGVRTYLQGIAFDPGALGGIAFTAGLEVRFGSLGALPLFPQSEWHVVGDNSELAAGDFDNDGYLDVFTASDFYSGGRLWRGLGDRVFSPSPPAITGDVLSNLAAADLNGDGNLDLASAGFGTGFGASFVQVRLEDRCFKGTFWRTQGCVGGRLVGRW